MDEIAFASAVSLSEKIRAKQIGCLELLDLYLKRAERYNPELNAIVAWQSEEARVRARATDAALAKGENWGPLHGIPMTVKESFDVAGLPTTFGNPVFAKNVPTKNAAIVDRLLSAGAVIYGKTNVPFMLIDSQTYNDIYGTTNNPWDLKRGPGGSSGGAAAVLATGLAALEAGSDIGGSLRNPGHYTGVYGHRTTYGIVSSRGHAPPHVLTDTDMSVSGPMARHAGDLALAMSVLAGADGLAANAWRIELPAPRAKRLKDFRVAVWDGSSLSAVSNRIVERLHNAADAVARAGALVDRTARPDFDIEESHRIYMKLLRAATSSRVPDEIFEAQKEIVASLSPDDRSHRAAVARGATLSHREWLATDEMRMRIRLAWRDFFEKFDVVLAPIAATPAFLHDQNPDRDQRKMSVDGKLVSYTDQLFWAGLVAMPYLPATAAPIGFVDGLPVGMQIIGPEGGDLTTIEFARLLAAEIGGFVAPPNYEL
jgi:amidase